MKFGRKEGKRKRETFHLEMNDHAFIHHSFLKPKSLQILPRRKKLPIGVSIREHDHRLIVDSYPSI